MNEQPYKLKRNKLHRVNPAAPGGYVTFRAGEVFIPTDQELKTYADLFEGPLAVETTVAMPLPSAALTQLDGKAGDKVEVLEKRPTLLEEKAINDLKMPLTGIRDAVRQADGPYLEVLLQAEGAHQPTPRVKVRQMIERRMRALAQHA